MFDLRANPGGYVNEAVGVAEPVRGRRDRVPGVQPRRPPRRTRRCKPGGLATSIPIVVLADGDTASSAEIVTGAIQDAEARPGRGREDLRHRDGAGAFDLKDGSSLRIGVERWLTRNGRPIWHEGLEPDVKVRCPTTSTLLLPDDIQDMSRDGVRRGRHRRSLKALELKSWSCRGPRMMAAGVPAAICVAGLGGGQAWPVRDAAT